jgi:hypothetical protein
MTKLIIYLNEPESTALKTLAEQEYRVPKAQASLIIRKELERLGMIEIEQESHSHLMQPPHPGAEGSMNGD